MNKLTILNIIKKDLDLINLDSVLQEFYYKKMLGTDFIFINETTKQDDGDLEEFNEIIGFIVENDTTVTMVESSEKHLIEEMYKDISIEHLICTTVNGKIENTFIEKEMVAIEDKVKEVMKEITDTGDRITFLTIMGEKTMGEEQY